MFEAKELLQNNNDWITLVFLSIFFILTLLKLLFNDRLFHTSVLFFSKKYVLIYFNKEKTSIFNLYQILFFLVQLLVFTLLFYYLLTYFNPNYEGFNLDILVIIFAGTCIYLGIRYLIGLFLATIFDLNKLHKKIVYEKINYSNSLALWVLPFILFFVYSNSENDYFIYILISIFVILMFIRYLNLLINNKKLIFSNLLYFILYLCALEIVPIVLILKLII